MDLTMAELVEQSGCAPRTIREYIARQMLPRPRGAGPAAVYTRGHLLRLWAIAKLRQDGMLLDDIKDHLATMSTRDMARCKPQPPGPPAPEAPPPSVDPVLEVSPRALGAGEPAARRTSLRKAAHDDALADAPRWLLVSLLPGLALMVRDDAAPVVRNAAAEIVARFGAAQS
jgi:DNA-binding transcriptional MerR regulator